MQADDVITKPGCRALIGRCVNVSRCATSRPVVYACTFSGQKKICAAHKMKLHTTYKHNYGMKKETRTASESWRVLHALGGLHSGPQCPQGACVYAQTHSKSQGTLCHGRPQRNLHMCQGGGWPMGKMVRSPWILNFFGRRSACNNATAATKYKCCHCGGHRGATAGPPAEFAEKLEFRSQCGAPFWHMWALENWQVSHGQEGTQRSHWIEYGSL